MSSVSRSRWVTSVKPKPLPSTRVLVTLPAASQVLELVVVFPSLVLLEVVDRFSALKAVLLVEPSRLVWLVVLPLAS